MFVPGMIARGACAIVNVASTAAFQPLPYMTVYGASKASVLSFSEALAEEVRGRGVRVLALCPGATETAFFDAAGQGAWLAAGGPHSRSFRRVCGRLRLTRASSSMAGSMRCGPSRHGFCRAAWVA
jgi:short-subunit dehydrogenase